MPFVGNWYNLQYQLIHIENEKVFIKGNIEG